MGCLLILFTLDIPKEQMMLIIPINTIRKIHPLMLLCMLLFIISDFVGDIDLKLLSKKHDVFAVMVRDRFEENPSELGYLRLIDMETKQSFEGNIDGGTLKSYKKALHYNDEKLYKQFKKQGIRFTKIYTHEEPALKLMKTMR